MNFFKLELDTAIAGAGFTYSWNGAWIVMNFDWLSQHVLLEGGALLVVIRLIIAHRDWKRRKKDDGS